MKSNTCKIIKKALEEGKIVDISLERALYSLSKDTIDNITYQNSISGGDDLKIVCSDGVVMYLDESYIYSIVVRAGGNNNE